MGFGAGACAAGVDDRRAQPAGGCTAESLTGCCAASRGRPRRSTPTPRYWVESFRLPGALERRDRRGLHSRGATSTSRKGIADGTGVILALPHLGGWEWAGRWLADSGMPITVVVEPVEPPELFEWFADFRRSLGMNVVPLGPGAGVSRDQGG